MMPSPPPPGFEVLLHAPLRTRIGPPGRWFLAGSHASRAQARLQYQELCQEFPDSRVILLLVMTTHDAETGRFRDRILESRGLAPLIDRKLLEQLTPAAKKQIAESLPWQTRQAPPPPAPPPLGLGWWLAGGSAALAVAVLTLLR